MVPILGIEAKGAKRWIDLFFFRFQPIEIIKPFFVLTTATIICSFKHKNINHSYLISLCLLTLIVVLLLNQPDIGQSILLITTWISIVFISGIKISYIILLIIILILFSILLFFLFPIKFLYFFLRLKTFMDPSKGDSFKRIKL